MRVVFMGTPQFAVPSLISVAESTDLVGVFTRPDSASGRGKSVRPSPVKIAALERGIPVSQPTTLRDPHVVAEIAALHPDVIVVAAYGLILPQQVLDVPPLGAINVHASVLPRWRGAAPIQRAILAGDDEAGVSIMRMEAGLDTGPYCRVATIPIDDAGTTELTDALARLGADALVPALAEIESGTAVWTPQDDAQATYADKITKSDVAIGPKLDREVALRHIRASSPTAPCRVTIAGSTVTLLAASDGELLVGGQVARGGALATKTGVLLGMSDGAILVTRLKPQAKGEMAAADWARGVRDLDTATWDRPS